MTPAQIMHAINITLIIIGISLFCRKFRRDRSIAWALPVVIWMIGGAVFSATYIVVGVHPDDNISYTEWARGLQTFGYVAVILTVILANWVDKHNVR
jgi:hypothetical protein